MARLKPISEQFRVVRQATLAATQRILVAVAKREHAKVLEADPRPVSFKRWVDGRLGAPEESVKGDGTVLYQYQRLDLVVQFAMDTLFDKSPVLSGDYRNAHQIFLNGAPVSNLKDWKPGDDLAIANYLPYSRKIEAGSMKMRVPGTDHVYQQAEQIVKGRYGNLASVKFTYRGIAGGGIIGGRAGNASGSRFPALVIAER